MPSERCLIPYKPREVHRTTVAEAPDLYSTRDSQAQQGAFTEASSSLPAPRPSSCFGRTPWWRRLTRVARLPATGVSVECELNC